MEVSFEENAEINEIIKNEVENFLKEVITLEKIRDAPIIIYQDGKSKGYYIKCGISSNMISPILDFDAKLVPEDIESFRANRELMITHNTYLRMRTDAEGGREFNDIIVEYNKQYTPDRPLKVWGGQHRSKAIIDSLKKLKSFRYHGFKVFFNLSKEQRTEIALISNTNMNVSNDLFDRLQEETFVGHQLRDWCTKIGLLKSGEDFADKKTGTDTINVKIARTFVTNYYLGYEKGVELSEQKRKFDENTYEPYLCESGAKVDQEYSNIIEKYGNNIWEDKNLIEAGTHFNKLHKSQQKIVKESKKIPNRKEFRNKAISEAIISSWAYVAGLLQSERQRLNKHYLISKTTTKILDPLNSMELSNYKHNSDDPTYRGLGTRSSIKERERMAQLFLARTIDEEGIIDKQLMNKAVSQVIGLKALQQGYSR